MSLKQKLHDTWVGVYESVTPPRTVSAFRSKGVLTPEEFVEAGDNLVNKCPTWLWDAGEPEKRKPYLPPNKQFLITHNVPCFKRVHTMEEDPSTETEQMMGEDGEEGWLATHGAASETRQDEGEIPSMEGPSTEAPKEEAKAGPSRGAAEADDEDEVPDMDEFQDDNNLVEDDAATFQIPYLRAEEPGDENILRTRTYDLSITYDKYYQTPRVWLYGYDEAKRPLHPEQVLQDVSQDHARKTVTIEDHPHLHGKHASVHPCKHSLVMKKILDVICAKGADPRVDQYLFIFLKFIASVIPTIEYDYTVDFDLGPSKRQS
ncbi:autophagy-related protein 3 [Klebsormidium nitens]|uniref:Autophagy-related protein 3 n=1 Tax=Klebsormidium nitens TaxID=105231 RepID=A0A1Y1HX90_KLENI|nr:autophagy-related protein 3 [Klebsormidium nitens]|eukprot:GAQ83284.1 autophagy-related protein 3 [Klebsormidium nitens]